MLISKTEVDPDIDTTPSVLAKTCEHLYNDCSGLTLLKQRWRPFICPFHRLLPLVSQNSSVLDVGCGSGIFLGLLVQYRQIDYGLGFDSNFDAISLARKMTNHLPKPHVLRFEHRDARETWPVGKFDVVSIIDVMHHVPPAAQQHVIKLAAERLNPRGLLIYKDMVDKPLWRAWANRCHDLILSRNWINYAPIENVERWCQDMHLVPVNKGCANMLWYGHNWLVCKKAERQSRHRSRERDI